MEPRFLPLPAEDTHLVEPGLPGALSELSEMQRAAVMMVHADGWTRAEAADALEISLSTLDTHLGRGLDRLRAHLGVSPRA